LTPGNSPASSSARNPLARDLDGVMALTRGLWDELGGARVLLTGGTGFFGCWLLETLLWANDRLQLGAQVVVVTRSGRAFTDKAPHLAQHPAVTLHEGDVRTLAATGGAFSHVIHAATDTRPVRDERDRLLVFDTIVDGTRRALELARDSGAKRFLLTSTGAVYGRQPAAITHLPEDYAGGPDPADPAQAGAEAKRAAEMLCAVYADADLQPLIARCFAFVGPYLPLDAQFAAGNFIRDGLQGGPIRVAGDGTPYRSYLYAADLAVWLWTILLQGQPLRPYNVGSASALTIGDLARQVADAFAPAVPVMVARAPIAGATPQRYVPAVERAETELGLRLTVPLAEGIRRTIDWHRSSGGKRG
jgi:nucleoside-diphosphate-sugar epimerase